MNGSDTLTVLIAEDDALNRLYLKTVLRRQGFHVLEAKNGTEAVSVATNNQPDIILMDLTMPQIDGIEAATQIRLNKQLAAVPIIAITAYETDDYGSASEKAGMNGFVTKPVAEEDLLETIKKHLG